MCVCVCVCVRLCNYYLRIIFSEIVTQNVVLRELGTSKLHFLKVFYIFSLRKIYNRKYFNSKFSLLILEIKN